jgi:hypothetical protein
MSRAWSDTRRSSGAFHAGSDVRNSPDEEHVWATAGEVTNVSIAAVSTATIAIARGTHDRTALTA